MYTYVKVVVGELAFMHACVKVVVVIMHAHVKVVSGRRAKDSDQGRW